MEYLVVKVFTDFSFYDFERPLINIMKNSYLLTLSLRQRKEAMIESVGFYKEFLINY